MVLEDNLVELNKQEIFHQIDHDILSQKKNKFSIVQKTRSNYKFVVYLDLIACLFALVGIIVVYSVFREQQIRLVSGQKGVKVLETTLISEINKQYEQDLLDKELELQILRDKLSALELGLSDALVQINEEAQQKFKNEKELLEIEFLFKNEGKNKAEQAALRREYDEKIDLLKQSITTTKLENERLEKEKFEQMQQGQLTEDQQEQATLIAELVKAQENLENSKEKLRTIQVSQPQALEELKTVSNTMQEMQKIEQKIEQKIANNFVVIQQNILEKQYAQAEQALRNVEGIYENETPNTYPETRKKTDLYFISLNREFIKKDQKTEVLSRQVDMQNNQIEALKQGIIESKTSNNSENLKEIAKKMRDFVAKFSNNRISREELQQKINDISDKLPESVDYAYKYIEFVQNKNSVNIPKNVDEETRKILNKNEEFSPEYKIVYLKNPEGFILDILDKKRVLITLHPGKRVSLNQQLEVYRVDSQDNFKINKIGYINVLKSGGDVVQASNANYDIKIGDLIYIKD